ncbi:MAG: hypothetical protein RMJ36_07205, partial [Candidatus Calescibacterium sp.]|nr:hypothetical protein [Candidatus Calescibacterium sp.]MDW8133422.1 hypothetical protein [Candidatus Calescibacterium sp.]
KNLVFLILFITFLLLQGCQKNNQLENIQDTIGVVNIEQIKNSNTYRNLEKQIEDIKKDMEQKLKDLSKTKNTENLEYFLSTNFKEKKEKLYQEFNDKLIKAIYYTANKEKIGLVVSYDTLPYGGTDITQKVIENLDNGNFENSPLFNKVEIISYIQNTSNVKKDKIQNILKQIYAERKIYVVIDKK